MQVLFEDKDLEQLITTGANSHYKKYVRDKGFMEALARDYVTICSVENAEQLANFSFLHYEKLKYRDCSSIRVMNGRVERLLFRETNEGLVITLLELDSTHYGNKK